MENYFLNDICCFCLDTTDKPFEKLHKRKYKNSLAPFEKIATTLINLIPLLHKQTSYVLCKTCSETVQKIFEFNQNCQKNLGRLKSYKEILRNNCTKGESSLKIELKGLKNHDETSKNKKPQVSKTESPSEGQGTPKTCLESPKTQIRVSTRSKTNISKINFEDISEDSKKCSQDSKTCSQDSKTCSKGSKTWSKDTRTCSEDPKTCSENPKTYSVDPKTSSENPKTCSEDPKTSSKESKKCSKGSKTCSEDLKNCSKDSKTNFDDPKICSKGSKTCTEDTKICSENSKTCSEGSKSISQNTKRISEGLKNVSNCSNVTDNLTDVSRSSKTVSKVSKNLSEAWKTNVEDPKINLKPSKSNFEPKNNISSQRNDETDKLIETSRTTSDEKLSANSPSKKLSKKLGKAKIGPKSAILRSKNNILEIPETLQTTLDETRIEPPTKKLRISPRKSIISTRHQLQKIALGSDVAEVTSRTASDEKDHKKPEISPKKSKTMIENPVKKKETTKIENSKHITVQNEAPQSALDENKSEKSEISTKKSKTTQNQVKKKEFSKLEDSKDKTVQNETPQSALDENKSEKSEISPKKSKTTQNQVKKKESSKIEDSKDKMVQIETPQTALDEKKAETPEISPKKSKRTQNQVNKKESSKIENSKDKKVQIETHQTALDEKKTETPEISPKKSKTTQNQVNKTESSKIENSKDKKVQIETHQTALDEKKTEKSEISPKKSMAKNQLKKNVLCEKEKNHNETPQTALDEKGTKKSEKSKKTTRNQLEQNHSLKSDKSRKQKVQNEALQTALDEFSKGFQNDLLPNNQPKKSSSSKYDESVEAQEQKSEKLTLQSASDKVSQKSMIPLEKPKIKILDQNETNFTPKTDIDETPQTALDEKTNADVNSRKRKLQIHKIETVKPSKNYSWINFEKLYRESSLQEDMPWSASDDSSDENDKIEAEIIEKTEKIQKVDKCNTYSLQDFGLFEQHMISKLVEKQSTPEEIHSKTSEVIEPSENTVEQTLEAMGLSIEPIQIDQNLEYIEAGYENIVGSEVTIETTDYHSDTMDLHDEAYENSVEFELISNHEGQLQEVVDDIHGEVHHYGGTLGTKQTGDVDDKDQKNISGQKYMISGHKQTNSRPFEEITVQNDQRGGSAGRYSGSKSDPQRNNEQIHDFSSQKQETTVSIESSCDQNHTSPVRIRRTTGRKNVAESQKKEIEQNSSKKLSVSRRKKQDIRDIRHGIHGTTTIDFGHNRSIDQNLGKSVDKHGTTKQNQITSQNQSTVGPNLGTHGNNQGTITQNFEISGQSGSNVISGQNHGTTEQKHDKIDQKQKSQTAIISSEKSHSTIQVKCSTIDQNQRTHGPIQGTTSEKDSKPGQSCPKVHITKQKSINSNQNHGTSGTTGQILSSGLNQLITGKVPTNNDQNQSIIGQNSHICDQKEGTTSQMGTGSNVQKQGSVTKNQQFFVQKGLEPGTTMGSTNQSKETTGQMGSNTQKQNISGQKPGTTNRLGTAGQNAGSIQQNQGTTDQMDTSRPQQGTNEQNVGTTSVPIGTHRKKHGTIDQNVVTTAQSEATVGQTGSSTQKHGTISQNVGSVDQNQRTIGQNEGTTNKIGSIIQYPGSSQSMGSVDLNEGTTVQNIEISYENQETFDEPHGTQLQTGSDEQNLIAIGLNLGSAVQNHGTTGQIDIYCGESQGTHEILVPDLEEESKASKYAKLEQEIKDFIVKKHSEPPNLVQIKKARTFVPRTFNCEVCNIKFNSKVSLRSHQHICSKKDPNASLYGLHQFKKVHTVSNETVIQEDLQPEATANMPYFCNICQKGYLSKLGYLRDQASHNDDKKFECKTCNMKFHFKTNLRNHLTVHKKKPNFNCTVCEKGFLTKVAYNRHKKLHKVENFTCKICDKNFHYKLNLTQHWKTHFEGKRFHCEKCDAKFRYKYHLKWHLCTEIST